MSKTKVDRKPPAPKNPRTPTYTPDAAETARVLQETISEGGERATMAYSALTRLAVLWALDAPSPVYRELLVTQYCDIMSKLYPIGVPYLRASHGAGAL